MKLRQKLLCIVLMTVLYPPAFYVHRVQAQQLAGPDVWDHLTLEIEEIIKREMVEGQIPSLTIAVVEGEEIVMSKGYGYANMWARTPAVPSTVYLIGSTFKAMSTVALLQQMEAGKFQLDDAVGKYLQPLRIRNEDKNQPVTFRHLLTHTSGLPADFGPFSVWGDESPPALENYLNAALRVESPPGSRLVYSNIAYSLVGYLVQQFSGQPFKKYISHQIFTPLEMSSTAFSPTPEMTERMAIPYVVDPSTNRVAPTEWIKASVWPAGIVYGTVLDQANWLMLNLNGGVFKGRHLINEETLAQMFTLQYEAFKGPVADLWGGPEAGYGLTWWTEVRNGEQFFAHSGSVPGYTAFLQGNKDQKLGVAILTNGNKVHAHLINIADEVMTLMTQKEKTPEEALSGN